VIEVTAAGREQEQLTALLTRLAAGDTPSTQEHEDHEDH